MKKSTFILATVFTLLGFSAPNSVFGANVINCSGENPSNVGFSVHTLPSGQLIAYAGDNYDSARLNCTRQWNQITCQGTWSFKWQGLVQVNAVVQQTVQGQLVGALNRSVISGGVRVSVPCKLETEH